MCGTQRGPAAGGAALEGAREQHKSGWPGLGFFFFFLIQKHHLHPAVKYFGILLGFVFLMWFNAADAPAAHPLAASKAA